MEDKKMKRRMLAFLLALLLILCACGKDSDTPREEQKPGQTTEKENTKPQMAYKATYLPVDLGEHEVRYINSFCLSGEKLFLAANCKTGPQPLADPATGEAILEDTGEPMEMDVEEILLFSVDLSTQAVQQLDFTPVPLEEGKEGSSYISGLTADGQGGCWITEQRYQYHYELPEDFNSETDDVWNYYVDDGTQMTCTRLDSQGQKIVSMTLQVPEDVYLYNTLAVNGSVYASDYQNIYRFNDQGAIAETLAPDAEINMVFAYSDTEIGVTCWSETGMKLQLLNTQSKTWSEPMDLPTNAYQILRGFGDYAFVYQYSDSFFGMPEGGTDPVKLLSWLDCDVDSSYINGYQFLEDGTLYALENTYSESTQSTDCRLIRLDRVDASTLPQKQELTLACMDLSWDLRNTILEFNRSHDDIRIVVEDYAQYATEADYYAGMTKLNTEILSGNVPDLFQVNERLPLEVYVSKGILQDLWPLIDADPELSREDLMTHFFDTICIDGGLYQAVSNFSIQTAVGRSDVVGAGDSWTLDDLLAVKANLPAEATILDVYDTQESMLQSVVLNDCEKWVDWRSKQCSFTDQSFSDLLELCAAFPKSFDDKDFDWSSYGSEGLRLRMRQQMLVQCYLSSFDMVQYYNAMCEGKTNFIGYPSADGNGSSFTFYNGLAISSTCANTDAAWSLVRTVLTEDYQSTDYIYQFPTNAKAFETYKQQMMTPQWFETDPETGEEVESPRNSYWFGDEETVPIYSMTQEEYDLFMDLYQRTNTVTGGNQEIANIITEECAAFFDGQKTAEQTARLIQDRVSLYVMEQG